MSLTSALLGSKLRILLTLVVAAGLIVGGGVALGVFGAPGVAGVHNSFGNVTDDATEIRTDLVVHNPNPVGVSLGGVSVDYDVSMNDVAMADGTKEGVSIGTGNTTLSLRTEMQNDRIPAWWTSHVRNGEHTDVRVDATVESGTLGRSVEAPPVEREVSTDLISAFNSTEDRPVNADQPLVSDPVAYVNETSARWGEVTDAETPIDAQFAVYNAKAVPLAVTEIGYDITMNGVDVGSGSTDSEHVIEGHTTETVEAETAIRNDRLDEWWVTHLRNDQVTELRIDFYAQIEVGGETFRVPLDELTYTETVETDVFGTKDRSGTATAPETTAGSDGRSETATTDGESTATTAAGTGTTAEDDDTTAADDGTTTDADEGTTTGEDDGLLALDADRLA